jgi:hypothetical protein
VTADVKKMEEVYVRTGSESPRRFNRQKRVERYKFTVPEPFVFGKCNSKIYERKFEDWLVQKENEEQQLLNQKFYPLSLPKNTKENRYEEMVLQEELRKQNRTQRARQRLDYVNRKNQKTKGKF